MSYIKPQHLFSGFDLVKVVYRLCPTSNHNEAMGGKRLGLLYIAYVLHQTTT